MSELKIGFVGLGDQGAPMAEAISDAGFELHVWARRDQSFDAISGVKYLRHDSLESLAVMVDVLSLCLRDDEDIWNLIRQHRLIEALRSGSIVVNHGTGDPTENEHIGAFLAESGIKYLDAPVSGGRPGAVSRTLTTLVGGDANDFARCREVFETFSRKVAHMGTWGAGSTRSEQCVLKGAMLFRLWRGANCCTMFATRFVARSADCNGNSLAILNRRRL